MTRKTLALSTVVAAIASTGFAGDTPCEERQALDCHWTAQYPFNTIARLFVEQDNGNLSGYGTGFVVSPHCALTNGHCLYKRAKGRYFIKDIHLMPGACRKDSGGYQNEFGTREALHMRTNDKFADPSYSPVQAVDYGALQFVCPFNELTTFMPLCFEYESDWVHMSGYPTVDTPDSSKNRNQWIGYGDVTELEDRWMRSDARSTNGASGSPAWNWQTNDALVEVFAINRGHSTSCNGTHTRLVDQNYDLIRSWMAWEPSLAEKVEAGCLPLNVKLFGELIDFFNHNPDLLLPLEGLRIEDPVAPPPTAASRRVIQVIENGLYEWAEYDLQPGNPNSNRLIQLIAAPGVDLPGVVWRPGQEFNPQAQGWLNVEAGMALLSGSAGRASGDVIGIEASEVQANEIEIEVPPLDDAQGEDHTPDHEAGSADNTCFGDLDGDGQVGGGDLGLILAMWGQCTAGQPCSGDLNGDGQVNGGDLGLLLGLWQSCDQP
ncbi:MAG: trypsin-like peptidase domain-containing protein [Phycisphaerales bacterium]|nr:trypsin-like peptidase domain-containing protein [Phycisphaerales bacterium]